MRYLKDKYIFLVILSGIILFFARDYIKKTGNPPQNPQSEFVKDGPFLIVKVIDGDTIKLDNNETVRLIGVDAPELHHPEIPVQRFAKESYEFAKKEAEKSECMIEYEAGNLRDRYGRLLAYVYIDDKMLNKELIKRGYAFCYTRFEFARKEEFVKAEEYARENGYGLWSTTLKDSRITNLVKSYESLNIDGKKKLDETLAVLKEKYPKRDFNE